MVYFGAISKADNPYNFIGKAFIGYLMKRQVILVCVLHAVLVVTVLADIY